MQRLQFVVETCRHFTDKVVQFNGQRADFPLYFLVASNNWSIFLLFNIFACIKKKKKHFSLAPIR